MFYKTDALEYEEVLEGVRRKTLVYGDKTLLSEFRLRKGTSIPPHRHPHEQTGYLVAGRLQLTIGDECLSAEAGDSWCIPGDLDHGAQALEDSIAVEVFSPVREDYIP
jgi:quercetin dioxygenase-like cupin family protein